MPFSKLKDFLSPKEFGELVRSRLPLVDIVEVLEVPEDIELVVEGPWFTEAVERYLAAMDKR